MDLKDSTPEENPGDQQDHSLDDSADTNDVSQTSQSEEVNQFFGNEEEDNSEDDTPSQTTDTDDDTDDDSNTDDSQDNSDSDDSVEPELTKWAESQNLQLNTPTEIALAKRLRDTQKAFHDSKTESKKKFVEATNDQTTDVTARLEGKLARMDFFEAHSDARELEGEMYDIAIAAKEAGDVAGFNYYQTPRGWETLLKIAKADKLALERDGAVEDGKQQERTNLAKKQQAGKPSAASTNSTPSPSKMPTDEEIGKMTFGEYQKFRAANPNWNPFG